MAIDVLSVVDLHRRLTEDMNKLMDQTIWLALDYADGFLNKAYTGDCQTYWPLVVNGEEVKDPVTKEPFTEDENPKNVLPHLDVSYAKISDTVRSGMLWVNTIGKPETEKLERAARMQEVYGCKPWTRLKQDMSENFGDIVKGHGETVRNRFGLG